jgi:hypothetical protein
MYVINHGLDHFEEKVANIIPVHIVLSNRSDPDPDPTWPKFWIRPDPDPQYIQDFRDPDPKLCPNFFFCLEEVNSDRHVGVAGGQVGGAAAQQARPHVQPTLLSPQVGLTWMQCAI